MSITPLTISGQEEAPDETPLVRRSLGDQVLGINIGLFIPLFFIDPNENDTRSPNLTVGGVGAVQWNIFLNSLMSVGLELKGMFALTPNGRTLFMTPISFRYTIYPTIYPFEFPVHASVGINISRLEESTKVDPFLEIGSGIFWNLNIEWGFGVEFQYWLVPQIYDGEPAPASDSRIGNFMTIMLGAAYHF